VEGDLVGLIIDNFNELLIGGHWLGEVEVFPKSNSRFKVFNPLLHYVIVLDSEQQIGLLLVFHSDSKVVHTTTHQPTPLFYLSNCINQCDLKFILSFLGKVLESEFVFERIDD
jgi:hypothetical protein